MSFLFSYGELTNVMYFEIENETIVVEITEKTNVSNYSVLWYDTSG